MRITIHVSTRDRHSELALLLQSLRTQSYDQWDIAILDDASGTPLVSNYFVLALINRLQLEGHGVQLFRNDFSRGVCAARNKLIESDTTTNPLVCRLDDDVILDPDYLFNLVEAIVIGGYDACSGVVPLLSQPEHSREVSFVSPIINLHVLDENGDLVVNKDDCGFAYNEDVTLPTHQFRTNLLYKRSITDAGVRYPDYLTKVGFREELFFSFEAIIRGFKIGVRTGAVAHHLQCPSGGCRSLSYAQDVALDDATARNWIKSKFETKGNFLAGYGQ
jgi:GT2 family glycosyltransferase